jgi:hypothetical protein
MSDYLLAAILAVLIAQNAPRLWAWAKPRYRYWRKMRRIRGRG